MHFIKSILLLVILLCGSHSYVSAQDCDTVIISEDKNEYSQREKSMGRGWQKTIISEVWVNMSGKYLYLNMRLKDTTAGITLHNIFEKGSLTFAFGNETGLQYTLPSTMNGNLLSIPLNVRSAPGMQVIFKQGDSVVVVQDDYKIIETFFRKPLTHFMFNTYTRENNTEKMNSSITFSLSDKDAMRLQQAVQCILKATQ